MNPAIWILASAAIMGSLGVGHLALTYVGPKLLPRNRAVGSSTALVCFAVGLATA